MKLSTNNLKPVYLVTSLRLKILVTISFSLLRRQFIEAPWFQMACVISVNCLSKSLTSGITRDRILPICHKFRPLSYCIQIVWVWGSTSPFKLISMKNCGIILMNKGRRLSLSDYNISRNNAVFRIDMNRKNWCIQAGN